MKKQLLILMALIISVIGYSQSFSAPDSFGNILQYNVTSANTVSVVSGSVINNINVEIPASVSNGGTTYSVTSIGINSFAAKNISSVVIPNTVTIINSFAFENNNLTTIIIPNSVATIGNQVFSNNSLSNIEIPNSVTVIGDYAFQTNNLTDITIPNSVTSIGNGAFRTNSSLISVTSLATTPPSITTISAPNDTFSISGDRSNIDLYIPSGTTGVYATDPGALWTGFKSVNELLEVGDTFIVDFITYEVTSIVPNTVEAIDYDMNGGTAVNIPAPVNYNSTNYSVTSIKFNTFTSKNLTSVSIPNSVIEIGANAFALNQLSSVIIPDNITTIRSGSFSNNNLTSIVIPENVIQIQGQAFKSNPLTDVISMPATPPNIPVSGSVSDAFDNHNNINLITPNGTSAAYTTDLGALWIDFKLILEITSTTTNTLKVVDYNTASGTTVTIPATVTAGSVVYDVTEIGNSAFFSKGLTSVTIPNSITTIGTSAFNTNSLTSVTIPDSVINIGSQAFVTNDLNNLVIGNSVTNIDFGAFVDNDLTSITIPSSVTNIGLVAFAANPLTSVTSLATTPPTITTGTNDTFNISGDRSNIHLHILPGTMGAYVTDAGALWTGFNPVTEDATLSTSNFELAHDIRIISSTDQVEVMHSNSIELQHYSIYSMSGAKIKEGKENTINVNTLSNGIYILELVFNEGRIAKKFIR